jgi:endonuclease/exonuclease/phosphatase family metal-dependent hydrolase
MKTFTKICLHFSVIFLAVSLCAYGEPVEAKRFKQYRKIDVMTRNLYIGVDVSSLFSAQENLDLLSGLVRQAYYEIVNPEFSYHAKAIVLEIAKKRPDVVALQHVYKVYKDKSDFLTNPMDNINLVTGEITPNATTIAFDYLQLFIDELKTLGLQYYVASSQELTDAELPTILYEGLFDIRITDRDVILVRKGVNVSNPVSYLYDTKLPHIFPAPDEVSAYVDSLVIYFTRGFVAADVKLRGNKYHVVNTHLETRLEALGPLAQFFQIGQAAELIAAIEDWPEPVILVGDFNSLPEDPIIPIDEDNTIIPPYKLLQLNGYRDVCASRLNRRHVEGLTFCQTSNLSNTESDLYERIDLIWVKNMPYSWAFTIMGPKLTATAGDHPSPVFTIVPDKEVFWPSDHAGVSAVSRIPIFN